MFIIDGHNLIGSGLVPGIRLDQEDDEWRLVQWLRGRQPRLRQAIVVVFDGGVPGGWSRSLSGGGVQVIFAAAHRSKADNVILNRLRAEMPRSNVTVVTNDAVLRQAVLGLRAQVMRADEFLARINRTPKRRSAPLPSARPEPQLSPKELEEWLRLFGKDDGD